MDDPFSQLLPDAFHFYYLHATQLVLLLGIVMFFGALGGRIFKKLKIPQVVGYIVIGLVIESNKHSRAFDDWIFGRRRTQIECRKKIRKAICGHSFVRSDHAIFYRGRNNFRSHALRHERFEFGDFARIDFGRDLFCHRSRRYHRCFGGISNARSAHDNRLRNCRDG